MNLALEYFADNPIIDELVCWPPRTQRIKSLRAANVLFRQPFIELELEDGKTTQHQFPRDSFARHWAEARVILGAITSIELISEFEPPPVSQAEELIERVFEARRECIEESDQMYDSRMYEQYVMQFGLDCKDLPEETAARLAHARQQLTPENTR